MRQGILLALGAYGLWGILPIYWKSLQMVSTSEILVHRMIWSLLFVGLLLSFGRKWEGLKPYFRQKRVLGIYFVAGILLGFNWFMYIWAVNAGFIVETSLGYFINPLVNVLLGVLFLGERMRRGQWAALALATSGVLYLTIIYGRLPWIALVLAFTFGIYALLKKKAPLPAQEGLFLETALLFLPALAYLLFLEVQGTAVFGPSAPFYVNFLLMFTGVATAVPLLLFAGAARRIPLSMLGLIQYTAPTLQFLIGVFIYQEPFSQQQLVGFSLIWLALAIYSGEGLRHRHRTRTAVVGI
jgi:chloramphenicol-sensitive protein RarD